MRGDDPFGARVLAAVRGDKLSFGLDRALDVHPVSFSAGIDGIRATISAQGKEIEISSPLLGEINLLEYSGCGGRVGGPGHRDGGGGGGCAAMPRGPRQTGARGGLRDVKVLVDYAHKPDALEAVLETLRRA